MKDNVNPMMSQSDFLEHYGVLGMKWGVRKAEKNRRNESYSNDQVKRDRQVYGNRGAKKINQSLNKGNSISVARGDAKTRRDRVMGKNKYARQGGKIIGAGATGALGFFGVRALAQGATTTAGKTLITKLFGSNAALVTTSLSNPVVIAAATVGAAKIGEMFSGDIAVAANMRANGYDPSRK